MLMQSHLAENLDEVRWVSELFTWSRSYLDVYDHFGLLREGAVYAHCIHLDALDRRRMSETGAAMAFCATSNLFLGSGLFDLDAALEHGVKMSGCTVHFVDETLDGGPVIAQHTVPVCETDTIESLSARILAEEHKLYPEAVSAVLTQVAIKV